MYKERQAKGDDSAFKCYYTDRQGVPLPVDITGKEGKIKYTNNSNFFVLGPSGSGKSFSMNTVMRQLYEQDTDCVIVDTGDSYEGICSYYEGTYISYSKEKPISMNPFKITDIEYEQNFGEKKNFLKSLLFQLFKGADPISKIEDTIINTTIVEYYEAYFHPFKEFTEEERKVMKETLLLEDKKNGEYDKFESEMEDRYGEDYELDDLEYKGLSEKDQRRASKLEALINDSAATEGEKERAQRALQRLTPEVIENKYLQRIDRQIEKIERQKKKLRVTELSFNSYYEFAIERIPQLMKQQNIMFDIHNFAAILKPFYKGGEQEFILNNDLDSALFDEKFIVFEIDKVKDDPVLFPIIVLIIMDVFTQKMRIKKGRKCLVIEEAIDCKKIFTINRLDNKDGRNPFKELFIKRGTDGDVYGVEEPPECYMAYTTEKAEKEALKLYKKLMDTDYQHAIEAFVRDWHDSGIKKCLEFSQKVLKEGRLQTKK